MATWTSCEKAHQDWLGDWFKLGIVQHEENRKIYPLVNRDVREVSPGPFFYNYFSCLGASFVDFLIRSRRSRPLVN
jgi:hypothetical protein